MSLKTGSKNGDHMYPMKQQVAKKSNLLNFVLQIDLIWIVGVFFFVLYFFSLTNEVGSLVLKDYPFGADVPLYIRAILSDHFTGITARHPITVGIITGIKLIIKMIPLNINKIAILKLFFAFIGSLNIVIVYKLFSKIGKQRIINILMVMAYGFSFSVWYFASVPESYIVSTLLYSCYLLLFISYKDKLDWQKTGILSALLIVCSLNEIISLFLLVIPLVYYGQKLFLNKDLRNKMLVHILSVTLISFFVINAVIYGLEECSIFEYYIKFSQEYNKIKYSFYELKEPLLNMFFFNIGIPAKSVFYATKKFPDYIGFFIPSLVEYFKHIFSALFLILWIGLLGRIKIVRNNSLMLSLLVLIILKFIFIASFNPGEAILYSSDSNLPLFCVILLSQQSSQKKYFSYYIFVFLLFIVLNNVRFFI